ncbi:hypothetical protein BIT28_25770 [Photobacterium proteolyticum]|uniref:Uncharacterized protein n=1 Tax=Photobacterium proteolyticum TaxID=1903952 RepID=A0A1Q9H1V0_9GAMM|nr:hypothetical protein [Photobacterium proteolyticum]OLQ81658.1 hypothetical protein BIT28_25770 [Photobacterium proteolyticum]
MNHVQIEQSFERRNIKRCLSLLFPISFAPEALASLGAEIIRLAAILRQEYKCEFDELKFVVAEAHQRMISPPSALKDVFSSIKKEETLGIHYLPAFLSCELQRASYDKARFEQYKALTLIVSVRLLMMGRHEPAVKRVCDEIRLFSDGRRENLAAWLPNVLRHNFPSLIQELERLRTDTANNDKTKQVNNQLRKFHVSYRDSYEFKEGIIRNVSPKEFRKSGIVNSSSKQQLDDGDETVIELREISISSTESESWEKEEGDSGQTRKLSAVTFSALTAASYASRAMQAKVISNRLLKKKLSLSCDIYQASLFEIKILLKECITSLHTEDSDTAQLLIFMLIFGNQCAQIRAMRNKKHKGKIAGVKRVHTLPSQKQRDELTPLLRKVDTSIIFPVPSLITESLRSLKFKNVTDADIKNYLQHINKKHETHITQTKISTFLSHKLKQEGIDPVLIELIKGSAPSELAALSYTQLESNSLLATYQRYLNFLSKISACQELSLTTNTLGNKIIGTPLAIDDKLLHQLFSALTERLEMLNSPDEQGFPASYHNLVTVHVQMILALSSGYRPVTGWLGKITDISLDTGQFWISDKENRLGDASRVIVLPPIALECIKQYTAFLNAAAFHLRNTDTPLCKRYREAASGQEHLFFYRSESHWDEVSPKTMAPIFDSIFPLPPNWHRHHIRTLLHQSNIHSELIAAWMGHADIGEASFAQYSSLNFNELYKIAEIINHHLNQNGIKVVQYG